MTKKIRPRVLHLISLLCLACALVPISHGAEPPPVSAFTAEPEFRMAKISPDGKTLAIVTMQDFAEIVTTIDLATMASTPATIIEKTSVYDFWWKGPDRIVFWLNDGNYSLIELKSKKQPIRGIIDRIYSVVNPLANDPDHMLITDSMGHLKKFHVVTGKAETYEKHQDDTFRWLTDQNGHAVAAQGRLNEDWFMLTRPPDGKDWQRTGLGKRDRPSFWPLAVYSDQRRLLGWDNFSANTSRVVVRDPSTGQDELLFHSEEVDPAYNIYWGDDTTHLRGVAFETDRPRVSYVDPKDAALAQQIDSALPDTINQISSSSIDETKLIIKAYSRSYPDTYYLFDRSARRISLLGRTRPGLDPKQLGVSHYLRFPARDGLPLTAILISPPATKTPPPLVVFVGSDFTSRISSVFQPYLQLLVSRGYAVMQVNHRGVDGFGQKHALAGNEEIDGKMCDDLADGITYAAKEGWADGKRVALWGEGLEGILSLFTLAHHPELFAVWINFNTPLTMTYWNPEYFVFGLHEKNGNSLPASVEFKTRAYMNKLDPAGRLKDVKIPSFLYYRLPGYDGARIEKVLRKSRVPVTFLTPPIRYSAPADYAEAWKQGIEDRERCYSETLKFLATYLPPTAQGAPPSK